MHIQDVANRKVTRLIAEKSPYLLLHAYNPVDLLAWSNEIFEKANSFPSSSTYTF